MTKDTGDDTNPAPAESTYDPFSAENMRSAPGDGDVEVEKVLTRVPVQRPNPRRFFRVHPDPEFTLDIDILEYSDGKSMGAETYFVDPRYRHLVSQELRRVRLFTCIYKGVDVPFLWPAKLPREGSDAGRRWTESALEIAEHAKKLWVRMVGNKELGAYEMLQAKGDLGEPQWPDKSFRDLRELGFRDHIIDREDHPVIQELNGEL